MRETVVLCFVDMLTIALLVIAFSSFALCDHGDCSVYITALLNQFNQSDYEREVKKLYTVVGSTRLDTACFIIYNNPPNIRPVNDWDHAHDICVGSGGMLARFGSTIDKAKHVLTHRILQSQYDSQATTAYFTALRRNFNKGKQDESAGLYWFPNTYINTDKNWVVSDKYKRPNTYNLVKYVRGYSKTSHVPLDGSEYPVMSYEGYGPDDNRAEYIRVYLFRDFDKMGGFVCQYAEKGATTAAVNSSTQQSTTSAQRSTTTTKPTPSVYTCKKRKYLVAAVTTLAIMLVPMCVVNHALYKRNRVEKSRQMKRLELVDLKKKRKKRTLAKLKREDDSASATVEEDQSLV